MSSDHINVCALMLDPFDTMPGQRFRIEQWEPFLEKQNIKIDYYSFSDEKLRSVIYKDGRLFEKSLGMLRAVKRRFEHVRKSSKYDAIYLYRAASMIGGAHFERMLSRREVPVIYDFDDAIFLTNTSEANRRFGWLKFAKKTAEICRLSDSVTVGNQYLAEWAKNYSDQVYIVPTSIDTDKYTKFPREASDKVVVGWTGSSTSQYHLEGFEGVLKRLVAELGVEIKVISDRKPGFSGLKCNWVPWSSETEVEITSQIDIGIMPIPDDQWSKGKCAAKALQYMALEIPAVCSDVGANREVIDHGRNGFLASAADEWVEYVGSLVNDASLRKRLGLEARRTVVEKYSMEKCARIFGEVIRSTVGLR